MALSPSETRTLLESLGHSPRKSLGQNFLIDGNIVRMSVAMAEIRPGEPVVEVGPGLGTLTAELLGAGAEVWAVELDRGLESHLRATLAAGPHAGRFHLMQGDAVEHPLGGYAPDPGREFKIVANLPYAISTPWLDAVLQGPLPERMVLMLQREAAQRYGATHGTKSFGAISIVLQAAYDIGRGHRVAASCFFPQPEIESYLLPLSRKAQPLRFSEEARRILRACFQQRRKQLGALLREIAPGRAAAWGEQLRAAGLSLQSRPEQVPAAVWAALAAAPSAA